MKKLIALFLVLVMTFTLASCDLFAGGNVGGDNGDTTTGTTTVPSTTQPTTQPTTTPTTKPTSTTDKGQGNDPDEDYVYIAFTSSEKQIMNELFGEVIPFIPNNEYYFETFSQDNEDGTSSVGISFYTFGNTQADFDDYRESFGNYIYSGTEDDEYGDPWYFYDSADGTYFVDISYYYYEGDYVVDVYAYIIKESGGSGGNGGNGGTDSDYLYTAFTSSEKSLFNSVIGAVIPFLANDEYYVEEYGFDYDDGTSEVGVNFYTLGNTKAEFDAYRALFSGYDFAGTEEDEYGDTWYFYDSADGTYYVDMAYYEIEDGYVVDVYVYYYTETGSSGGNGGNGGNGGTDENVITNADAGLPRGENGVFDVDFTRADNVKDVTDQGYYLDGCPTTGSPAVLVIPVQFSDVTAAKKGYTTEALVNAFSKGGQTDYYSVYDYYYISSYGQLTLDITVLDYWFTPKYDSNYYYNATYDYYGD